MNHGYRSRSFIAALLVSLALVQPLAYAQKSKTKKMPKEELDELMNDILPFAQKMLSEHGEFFPYGGAITSKGEIIHIGASDGDEQPPSQKLIDVLIESFQAQAKAEAYRATAIVFDVRVKPPSSEHKTDAVQINLDHAGGVSVECFLPYVIKDKGKVVYGEMFAQKGSAKIFKQP
jgi:hypothetical protein